MKYAAYFLPVLALIVCLGLRRRRQKVRERRHRYQQPQSFRVFKPDGDPFEERVEFHIRKQ